MTENCKKTEENGSTRVTPTVTVVTPPASAISKNLALVFGVLFGISEALGQIPALQANSVFQLVINVLKALSGK